MGELKTKLRKTQYWLKHDLFVFDNVILMVALVFCLIWTWGSISSMSRNWSLSQEVMNRQREKALLELEVETLELENEYYLSDEYQELAARKYQGKMLPGETMVYLPTDPETTTPEAPQSTTDETAPAEPLPSTEMSNFEQWIAFLFGIRL